MSNFHLPSDPSRWADPAARGNCLCRPSTPACAAALKRYGLEGIIYKNNEPDFTQCSIASIKIPMMTHKRKNTESFRTKQERRISHKQDTYQGMSAEQVAAAVAAQTSHDHAVAGNFDQADAMLAQQWTAQNRDGHVWTAKMVESQLAELGIGHISRRSSCGVRGINRLYDDEYSVVNQMPLCCVSHSFFTSST